LTVADISVRDRDFCCARIGRLPEAAPAL